MKSRASLFSAAFVALASSACGSAPRVTIAALPADGAEGSGIPFVVPRSVLRIDAEKSGAASKIGFTAVPVAYAEDGKTALPRFLASDGAAGLSPASTSFTLVKYADELIVKEIGTQVSDARKTALGTVMEIAALAGAVHAAGDCGNPPALGSFVIEKVKPTSARAMPNHDCWGYSLKPAAFAPVAMKAYPVSGLAAAGQVGWFPIAACRPWVVTVYQCKDVACATVSNADAVATAVLSLSDGSEYRRVPLPAKGSITLHPDFCQADLTNGSVDNGDWALLNQFLSEVKAAAK